jgi:uncharacterized protein (TIGR03085 family)
MTAHLRDARKAETCRLLGLVRPDAPTLCAGWTAHDLAAHLWGLNHAVLQPVTETLGPAPVADRLRERVISRWSYQELLRRLTEGPSSFRWMPADVLEGHRHALGEWYIHGEDVRRVHDLPADPGDDTLQEALWRRLLVAAPQLKRRECLEFRRPDGVTHRIGSGSPTHTITGRPSELLLWAYGRTAVADVVVAGLPAPCRDVSRDVAADDSA